MKITDYDCIQACGLSEGCGVSRRYTMDMSSEDTNEYLRG